MTLDTGMHVRATPTSTGDRLFIHTQENGHLHIYTALVEAGKVLSSTLLLSSGTGLAGTKSLELLPGRLATSIKNRIIEQKFDKIKMTSEFKGSVHVRSHA